MYIFIYLLDEILEEFGYIGVFFYNEITANLKSFKTRPENFLFNILEFYCKCIEMDSVESLKQSKVFIDIFQTKLKTLRSLLNSQLINSKEIVLLKIIIDILIHYF